MPRLRLAAYGIVLAALVGCGPKEKIIVLHPDGSDAARDVFDVEFIQQITVPQNFVMRPDELAAVTVDHKRQLVYAGSREGTLLALDTGSGGVRWEYPLGAPASGVPVIVDDDTLLIGTDNGVLIALDLDQRTPRWSYETQGTVRTQPVVGEGVVYFANSRDQVFALDSRSGTWRWQYEREFQTGFTIHGRAGLTFAPAADQTLGVVGTLYTGFDDGRVVAIDAASGEALWIANVAPPEGGRFVDCDSTPLLDETAGEVVVTGQQTGVFGLATEDGSERWRLPVRAAGTVVRGPEGMLVFASSLEGLFAIDPGGRVRWRRPLDPGVVSTPVVVGDVVFTTHSASGLLAHDARDGSYLARLHTGSGMSSVPIYDAIGHRFYATSNRGVLLGLRVSADLVAPAG